MGMVDKRLEETIEVRWGRVTSGDATMRKILRDNGLSLVMFGLFVLFLVGHSVAGYYDYNDDQHAHQQSLLSYPAYLTSGHFWATVFENWESEFLHIPPDLVVERVKRSLKAS
jgi:hypothetical protein